MARVDVGYRKDLPATVRLNTKFAPFETYTVQEADTLIEELTRARDEARAHNEEKNL